MDSSTADTRTSLEEFRNCLFGPWRRYSSFTARTMSSVPFAKEVSSSHVEPAQVEASEYIDLSASSPIPKSFFIVSPCCCAFSCSYCDFPKCWGCKGNCQMCCLEQEGFCCKSLSHDEVCCVCFHDTFECVAFAIGCKTYRQCCCCEWICGCPLESAYVNTEPTYSNVPRNETNKNVEDSVPCSACLCSISSCFFAFPACLSCYEKTQCCCLESETACCKLMCCQSNSRKESLCVVFEKSNLYCLWPRTCVKSITQCFCLDSRCAIPCDKDVPCLCMGLPFCTLCANFGIKCGCCLTIKQLLEPPAPPAPSAPVSAFANRA